MKIAISGKGGVGKTTLAALLAKSFSQNDFSVIAIDADPDANLAATLGFADADKIVPISELDSLIEERTGAKPGQSAPFFTLNPRVDDIPDNYSVQHDNIRLMVMGRIKRGGTGCYCPEGALLQALVSHLLLQSSEVVIMDMEAGVEHLARGTAKAVDKLIIVVEPGRRSIETAHSIIKLAQDLGLTNISIVGNRVRSESDKEFIMSSLPGSEFLGFIPYDPAVIDADITNSLSINASQKIIDEVNKIYNKLMSSTVAK
jgi:CO dehydrogenase maturation factor